MNQPHPSRLRPHPIERFESSEHYFDLSQSSQALQNEAHPAQGGHRQITLYHYGSVTMVLFLFEAGSSLPEHIAEGLDTIHVLEGDLTVKTPAQTYEMSAGSIVVLNPGVSRSIHCDWRFQK